jgi:hypothetical protein
VRKPARQPYPELRRCLNSDCIPTTRVLSERASGAWRRFLEDGYFRRDPFSVAPRPLFLGAHCSHCGALRSSRTPPLVPRSRPIRRTREAGTPLPSNSPHDHMILRVDLVGSHGRWKRPCLPTAHMTI